MLAKNFIFERLKTLSADFPSVQVKYCFNERARTHIVELTPVASYYTDTALESAWMKITKEFMEMVPTEDISFISSDSILHIENPEFSFNSAVKHYSNHPILGASMSLDYWTTIANALADQVEFQHLVLPEGFDFPLTSPELKIWDKFNFHHFSYSQLVADTLLPFQLSEETQREAGYKTERNTILPGNTSYAMAA